MESLSSYLTLFLKINSSMLAHSRYFPIETQTKIEKLLFYAWLQTPYYRNLVLVIEKILGGSIIFLQSLLMGESERCQLDVFLSADMKKKIHFFHRRIINQKPKKPSNLSTGDGASFYAAVKQKKLISFTETSCN